MPLLSPRFARLSPLASFECRATRAADCARARPSEMEIEHAHETAFYIYSQFSTLYAFTARVTQSPDGRTDGRRRSFLPALIGQAGGRSGAARDVMELHNGGKARLQCATWSSTMGWCWERGGHVGRGRGRQQRRQSPFAHFGLLIPRVMSRCRSDGIIPCDV